MDFHKGLICSVVIEFSPNLHTFTISSFFFFFARNFPPLKMTAVNEWARAFFPTSLNQMLGLSRETAFCSSSRVARLKIGFLIIGGTVQEESLSLVRRGCFVARVAGGVS